MNVYQAISAVQKDLSTQGISKDRKNTQGSGYAFRGIDDVYNALAPFLAKHGLCILPRVLNRESVERQSKAGGALFYITVEVEFDLVAADGSKHTIKTFGEAMDSGDKATNKAMSAAYKYACMQSFCIPTEGDNDADSTTQPMIKPAAAKSVPQDIFDKMPASDQEQIRSFAVEVIAMASKDDIAGCVEYVKSLELDADWTSALWSQLDSKIRSAIKKYKEENK